MKTKTTWLLRTWESIKQTSQLNSRHLLRASIALIDTRFGGSPTYLSEDAVVVHPSAAAATPAPHHDSARAVTTVQPAVFGIVNNSVHVALVHHLVWVLDNLFWWRLRFCTSRAELRAERVSKRAENVTYYRFSVRNSNNMSEAAYYR